MVVNDEKACEAVRRFSSLSSDKALFQERQAKRPVLACSTPRNCGNSTCEIGLVGGELNGGRGESSVGQFGENSFRRPARVREMEEEAGGNLEERTVQLLHAESPGASC